MKVADMDKKIDIQKKKDKGQPFGNEYEDVATNIWAKKEQLVGTQLIQAMGEGNKAPYNFIIRRNDSITNEMYVKHNNKMYDIQSATPLSKNPTYTILTCVEVIS